MLTALFRGLYGILTKGLAGAPNKDYQALGPSPSFRKQLPEDFELLQLWVSLRCSRLQYCDGSQVGWAGPDIYPTVGPRRYQRLVKSRAPMAAVKLRRFKILSKPMGEL